MRPFTQLARNLLVIVLVPTLVYAQIGPKAHETLDQLKDSPSNSTARLCCDPQSIWGFPHYHDLKVRTHQTLHSIARLPFASLAGFHRSGNDGPTVYRGQEPEAVFDWTSLAPSDTPRTGWVGIGKSANVDDSTTQVPLPETVSQSNPADRAFEPPLPVDEEYFSGEQFDPEPYHAAIARAEQTIRESFAARNDQLREQFESATKELFEARLALALSGDSKQLADLVQDTQALWENTPRSFAAVTALQTLTRYYGTLAARPVAERPEALKHYVRCLSFQLAELDPSPEETPQALFSAAQSLLDLNLVAEAVPGLQQIVEHCPDDPVASNAAALLAGMGLSATEAGLAGTATVEEIAPGRPDEQAAEGTTDQLYALVASAEELIRANNPDGEASTKDNIDSVFAALCEARLQLALRGDAEQFERLHHTAAALCESSPNSPSAMAAIDALTRYYEAHSAEDDPQRFAALPHYARCLQYQIATFDPVPAGAPARLLDAARELARDDMSQEAADCLNQVLERCPRDPVASDAAHLLTELTGFSVKSPPSETVPETSPLVSSAPPAPEARELTRRTVDAAPPAPDLSPAAAYDAETTGRGNLPQSDFEWKGGPPGANGNERQAAVAFTGDDDRAPVATESHRAADPAPTPVHPETEWNGVNGARRQDTDPHSGPQQEIARWHAMIADAEREVEATFNDRDGASSERYEAALSSLCEASLQLALWGYREQYLRLYQTTSALCEKLPNSASARIAMDALTRYYEWHAADDSPQRQAALPQYARCLRYQVAMFDPMPPSAPARLLAAAEAMLQEGMPKEATACLERIVEDCSGSPVAADAANLLASVNPRSPATAPLPTEASRQPVAEAGFNSAAHGVPLPPTSARLLQAEANGEGAVWEPALNREHASEVPSIDWHSPRSAPESTERALPDAGQEQAPPPPEEPAPANDVPAGPAEEQTVPRIDFDWNTSHSAARRATTPEWRSIPARAGNEIVTAGH